MFAVFVLIKEKIANTFVSAILNSNGADNRNRTCTLLVQDPKSCASTNSAISA